VSSTAGLQWTLTSVSASSWKNRPLA
jgi:hypothetical protein